MTASSQTIAAAAPCAAKHSLRANVAWVFAANAVYLASQWLILAAVAKLGSPEMVGQFSLGFAVTAPIFLLSNLRLRTVQATDAGGEYSPADYIRVRVIATLLALAAVGLLCLLQPRSAAGSLVVMFVALSKSFESGSDLLYGFFQQQDRTSRMTVSIMVRGICSVTAVALASYYRHDAVSASAALCGSSVLLLLFCDIPLAAPLLRAHWSRAFAWRGDWAVLRRLASVSFPLGLSAMLMSLGANMPRYFIERTLGTREVGIFSAVWYVATAGGYIVSAMAEGASPRLGRLFAFGSRSELNQLLHRLLGIAIVLGLAATVFSTVAGKTILALIYNRDYLPGWQLLIFLSFAATIANAASILSYGLIAVRKYRDHLIALVIMTAITGLGCALLLPTLGINGAAFALMLGYFAQAVWGIFAVNRLDKVAAQ